MSLWPRVTLIGIGFLLVAGVAQSSVMRPLWQVIGVIGPPESYTALSFANPRDLPIDFPAKRSSLTVAFLIANAATRTQNYTWIVSEAEGKNLRRISAGNVNIAAGKTAKVSQQVKITCKPGQHLELTVSIAHQTERIDALMNCTL